VVVFGKLNYLEVANHDLFRAKLDAEPITAEDEAALAALGL
jgi:MraZ protein